MSAENAADTFGSLETGIPVVLKDLPTKPDLQVEILAQLETLVDLQRQAMSNPPIATEFIWNTLLQVLGLIAAALFGAFSVLAWQLGQAANGLASTANTFGADSLRMASKANCLGGVANWLSLVNFCQSNTNASFCNRLSADYSNSVSDLYKVNLDQVNSCLGGSVATPTASPPPPPPSSGSALNSSSVTGIVIGVVSALLFGIGVFYLPVATYRTKRRRSKEMETAIASNKFHAKQ